MILSLLLLALLKMKSTHGNQRRTAKKKTEKYQKRERIYPSRLLKSAKLKTTAKATNMNLPSGYHFHTLTTAQRKSAATIALLSTVCQRLITRSWATVHLESALRKGNVITVTHGASKAIVAFIIFKTRGSGKQKSHYIDLVCTRRTHQGRGLGTILIRHAILLFFRTAPKASIYLKTWHEKVAFYENLGFRVARHAPLPQAKSSSLSLRYSAEFAEEGTFYMKFTQNRAQFQRIAKNINNRLRLKKNK